MSASRRRSSRGTSPSADPMKGSRKKDKKLPGVGEYEEEETSHLPEIWKEKDGAIFARVEGGRKTTTLLAGVMRGDAGGGRRDGTEPPLRA